MPADLNFDVILTTRNLTRGIFLSIEEYYMST